MPHAFAVAVPSFLASLVEFVEALTIVLAVGVTRGWTPALLGSGGAVTLLALLVATFGPTLYRVPLVALQLAVGILLIFFGLRWVRKALLRYAGVIALHDEKAIFNRSRNALAAADFGASSFDGLAFGTTFQVVALEGLEVIFIVLAVGAGARQLPAACAGAAAALVVVIAAGLILRAPLARIPENVLKLSVGIVLTSVGTLWTGEGLRIPWFGGDAAVIWLASGFCAASAFAYALTRFFATASSKHAATAK